jgi:hypothetical protein
MIDCGTFLEQYSGLRDEALSWPEREQMQLHLAGCASCAHYDRVVRGGAATLRALPELEVSDDFAERLRWRLHQADDEARRARLAATPGQAVGTFAIAAAVAMAAWVPLMNPRPSPARLPAVAASAPESVTLLQRLIPRGGPAEATTLTSRLAEIGVRVSERPYHELVFSQQGPLLGQLAVNAPPAPEPGDRLQP